MVKKLLLGILLAMLVCTSAWANGDTLLSDGGFEDIDSAGTPADWYTMSYYSQGGYSLFEITDEKAHTGQYSAKIVNANANDARYVTLVKVEPESLYRVSGYIYVENMTVSGNGANFALEDICAVSESVYDTDGEWQYVEWYGETGAGQTEIALGVRIGGYGAESTGIAYFDDIRVEKVESVPDGVYADVWYSVDDTETDASTQNVLLWLVLLGVAAVIPAGWLGLKRLRRNQPQPSSKQQSTLLHPRDAKLHLGWRDFLIMGITFVAYCGMTFANLGSLKAPQTAWVSTGADEQVVFELEEETTFKLAYYAGVSYNNFSVSVSDDGETWSNRVICRMRQSLCYRWMYITPALEDDIGTDSFMIDNTQNIVWLTGKYLRINAEFAGLNLWEIILRDENGDRVPVTLVSHTGAKEELQSDQTPENLIDEQDTLEGEPGWFNGTYFDEVYFARTAYEHLHGQAPFETSHPPLGKLMISVGIWLFGMTPFGWRFIGALIGALMLPAMYLLGKQLTKSRTLAAFAMLLMTFDLMHFTQTRLATIDSYPVFFIILSYLCMARYIMTDKFTAAAGTPRVFTAAFVKSLIPLLFSGLFIGLAIASKWTGLYAGAGLAVLFGYSLFRQYCAGRTARALYTDTLTEAQTRRVQWTRAVLLKRVLVTCGFCVIFFLAIPAGIYYLSYIPYLSPTGPVTIARIIRVQQSMYAYHSTPGLGMDHQFYSPWWQWPLILKPIWYASDSYVASGFARNIVCLGNPAVFYVGAVCMVLVFVRLIRKGMHRAPELAGHQDTPVFAIVAIGFLAQYLPWTLVPRSMFFYHYFASLVFIILATMLMASLIANTRLRNGLMAGLVLAAAVCFVLFYPYASGATATAEYMTWIKWFPNLPV